MNYNNNKLRQLGSGYSPTRAIRTNCFARQIDVITLAFSGRIDNNRATEQETETKGGQRGQRKKEVDKDTSNRTIKTMQS